MAVQISPSIIAVGKFVIHIVVIAAAFVVLSLVALGLNIFAHWLQSLEKLPDLIVDTVFLLEYFVFAVDVISFVIVALVEAKSLISEIARIHTSKAGSARPRYG